MITAFSITACALTMLISWLVSQGRLKAVDCLGIVNGVCFIVINCSLAVGGQLVRQRTLTQIP